MENKTDLDYVEKEVERLENLLITSKNELETFKIDIPNKISNLKKTYEEDFNKYINNIKENIMDRISQKKEKVTTLLKNQLNKNSDKVKQFIDESNVTEIILQVLTSEQLKAFEANNLITISSEEELNNMIDVLKEYSDRQLPKQISFYHYFNLISDIQIDNKSKEIYYIYIIVIGFMLFLLILSSPLLVFIYCLFGVFSFYRTLKINTYLNLYQSILNYLDSNEIKAERSLMFDNILSEIEEFLDQVEQEYLELIETKKFKLDESKIIDFKNDLDKTIKDKERFINSIEIKLNMEKKRLDTIKSEIEKDRLKQLKFSEEAERLYLTFDSLQWKKELPKDIYLGKSEKNKVVLFPVIQDNILIISENIDYLFQLAQLHIIQLMMHVHPNRVSQNVLDYKYMCGNLQPFLNIPSGSLTLLSDEDTIKARISSIEENIFLRSTTILKTMTSLEDFNSLMETFNASGETYVFTYIFGLESFSKTFENFLRNGKRTGHFFQIYLTVEEFIKLNSTVLIELLADYYFIGETPNKEVFPTKHSKSDILQLLEKT